MSNKNLNTIVAIEQAISKKYGEETIRNPKSDWTPEKEKEYLLEMKELYRKVRLNEVSSEKIDFNGIKVSKKLFSRKPINNCPVCKNIPKKSLDDVCLIKYDCCSDCYIKYVEDREERWSKGWRPNI
jgi:hypothetical protein